MLVVHNYFFWFKDAQDLGISIEILPLSCPDGVFKISQFYAVCLHIYDIYICYASPSLDFFSKVILIISFFHAYLSIVCLLGFDWVGRRWSRWLYARSRKEVRPIIYDILWLIPLVSLKLGIGHCSFTGMLQFNLGWVLVLGTEPPILY